MKCIIVIVKFYSATHWFILDKYDKFRGFAIGSDVISKGRVPFIPYIPCLYFLVL